MAESSRNRVDPKEYRNAIGHFATGVAIITARDDEGYQGMTVNSLTSVSLDPTLLLVCLANGTRTLEAIQATGFFVVNILSHRQISLSNGFARPAEDHFEGVDADVDDEGVPYLPGSLARVHCRLWRVDDGGDHRIVLGEVTECHIDDGEPLAFYLGRYVRHIDFDDYPVATWWA